MIAVLWKELFNWMMFIGVVERQGGKRGRGSAYIIPFVAAVSLNDEGHAIAINMNQV